jgi:hypothetical protein
MKDLMPPHRKHAKVRGDFFHVEVRDRDFLEIETGAEGLAAPRDHHRADRVVRLGVVQRVEKLLQTLEPQRIVELRRNEGDGGDAIGELVLDPFVSFIGHSAFPFLRHRTDR